MFKTSFIVKKKLENSRLNEEKISQAHYSSLTINLKHFSVTVFIPLSSILLPTIRYEELLTFEVYT